MKAYIISDDEYQTPGFKLLSASVYDYFDRKGYTTEAVTVRKGDLAFCAGCFSCWIKTPGECVISDGISEINKSAMSCDLLVYLTPVIFGQFSANIKTVIDRWLPNLLPFFETKPDGRSTHPGRYDSYPRHVFIGYADILSPADEALFREINGLRSETIKVLFWRNDSKLLHEALEKNRTGKGREYILKNNAVIISASPKANQNRALSEYLAMLGKDIIESELISVGHINVKDTFLENNAPDAYKMMLESDSLVMIFPLYIYSLPGILMRFLQDFYAYFLLHRDISKLTRVFAVVNCGFPDPEICGCAIRVIENFSQKIGARFCCGVQIGGGGTILYTKDEPIMQNTITGIKEAFSSIKDHITDNYPIREHICIQSGIQKEQYFQTGNRQWIRAAAKNGLSEGDLYRQVCADK